MRAVSESEGQRRLAQIGVAVELRPRASRPRYADVRECRVYEVEFDDHFSAAQDMAEELLTPPPQPRFRGGVLWLYQWGHEPIAMYTFERFRKSYGVEASVPDQPVMVFDEDEERDAVAAMGLMMTYGWDCFFVAADAAYMALSCNEMILTLVTGSDEAHAWYTPIIAPLAMEELTGTKNTFCRPPGG
jgi:hypothetical protein